MNKIGFIQGRLSPLVNGKIQAFPWADWQNEFVVAEAQGLHLMEWTLDQDRLYKNPLLTESGQDTIRMLASKHNLSIPSLTCDCFMQAPFWKVDGEERDSLKRDFLAVAEACALVGIEMLVVPLVDNGRLDDSVQKETLVSFLEENSAFFDDHGLKVIFESDFGPNELARFIGQLDAKLFGINYDIGNSAASGFNPSQEINGYGKRIMNVHVKDRLLGGTTVPLGSGNVDFEAVFSLLSAEGYSGNYILQTARAKDGNHTEVMSDYRDMVHEWIRQYGA